MPITTAAEYEKELTKYSKASDTFKSAAKVVGIHLANNKRELAQKAFKAFCDNNKLVYWESLVLADLSTLEKEKFLLDNKPLNWGFFISIFSYYETNSFS